ncbi:MAG TPA: UdgX family uracil-DNA binding protein [Kineosporiaceae bacterium]|nr:UdgX family uracil-DNA binding protein [Kineosporiaceae bacterium]
MPARIARPGAAQWVPETDDLDTLRSAAPSCRGCELWEPATQVVFSAGNPHAPVVLVGEQPGDVEDQQGVPFVGPAGRLLRHVLEDAGIAQDDVYLTNAVKHFRFTERGKRRLHQAPDLGHVSACRAWLLTELRIVGPRLVVVLGATAAKSLLGTGFRVTRQRGVVIESQPPAEWQYLATVHPSAVLRAPAAERAAARQSLVDDLRVVADVLQESPSGLPKPRT